MTQPFMQQIADRLMITLNDDLVYAIEGACITGAEWADDPETCLTRVRGALEEMGYD